MQLFGNRSPQQTLVELTMHTI